MYVNFMCLNCRIIECYIPGKPAHQLWQYRQAYVPSCVNIESVPATTSSAYLSALTLDPLLLSALAELMCTRTEGAGHVGHEAHCACILIFRMHNIINIPSTVTFGPGHLLGSNAGGSEGKSYGYSPLFSTHNHSACYNLVALNSVKVM